MSRSMKIEAAIVCIVLLLCFAVAAKGQHVAPPDTISNITTVGDFGNLSSQPALSNDGVGWVRQDANDIMTLTRKDASWLREYEFEITVNGSPAETYLVAADAEFSIPADDPTAQQEITIIARDTGWLLPSGTLRIFRQGCDTTISCEVDTNTFGFNALYRAVIRRATDQDKVEWHYVGNPSITSTIFDFDDALAIQFQCYDTTLDIWRRWSPVIEIQARDCDYVPPTQSSGDMSLRGWWVNSWTYRIALEDSLNSETSSIDPATVEPSDFTRLHDGVEKPITGLSELRWGWYFDAGGTSAPGVWELTVPPGAVATIDGTTNADTLYWSETVVP